MRDFVLNPKTTHLEFFGPVGCTICILLMPMATAFLYLYNAPPNQHLLDTGAFTWYACWFAFQLLAFALIPGEWAQGVILRNGTRLSYKLNAFRVLIATHIALAYVIHTRGLDPLVWVADNALALAVASFVFSASQAVVLYAVSFRDESLLLSTVGNSGNVIHDFWMGRELNPRIGLLDLKQFCELRPGIFLWIVMNYAYAAKQYVEYGSVGNSMIFVCIGQLVYASDSVWFENAILTTMDITTDGFGYMLSVGDLLWVPFTFSIQARYLAYNPLSLSPSYLALLVAMNIASYITFRGSNSQKNDFRTTPDSPHVADLKYIKTDRGTRLLISGWWGMSRHVNYFGDWCMGLSWCMATGFTSLIPYFYVAYFATLLVHRAYRDDVKCREKYGKDWEKYCDIVPYRIVPYVY